MPHLLITGFAPFGGESRNPAWDAVVALPDRVGRYTLTRLCLPVVFGEAAQRTIEAAQTCCPDVILCIGQAGGRAAVTPEFIGINLRHARIPDNAGDQPLDAPCIRGGAAAYFATVPARRMVEAIAAAGVAAAPSYSAGTYVCNDLLYLLLARCAGTPTRVGFIHVPYIPEQGHADKPSMPLADIVRALEAAIGALDAEDAR